MYLSPGCFKYFVPRRAAYADLIRCELCPAQQIHTSASALQEDSNTMLGSLSDQTWDPAKRQGWGLSWPVALRNSSLGRQQQHAVQIIFARSPRPIVQSLRRHRVHACRGTLREAGSAVCYTEAGSLNAAHFGFYNARHADTSLKGRPTVERVSSGLARPVGRLNSVARPTAPRWSGPARTGTPAR